MEYPCHSRELKKWLGFYKPSLYFRRKNGKNIKNLLFNFVSVFVFLITIVVCFRAIFDTNMILYYRYGINFNPAYFSDNLSMIESMLYMIGGANVLLLICDIFNKKPKSRKVVSEDIGKVEKDNEKKDSEKSVKKSLSKDDEKDEE